MPRSIVRTITTALALTALAAPTALARPVDTQPFAAQASTTAHQVRGQDSRAIAARDDAAGRDLTATRLVLGPPTWPMNPQPITSAPVAKATDGGDGGVSWTTIALGIAGSLLAVGAIAGITSRTRRAGRARIAV